MLVVCGKTTAACTITTSIACSIVVLFLLSDRS